MKFTADLHIHSKYSRATAKNLDFENLYHAAQIKGVHVVGTGDFTYPDWIKQIETKLEEAEPGLFALKKEIADEIDKIVPERCRQPVRFILQTEISNIYKKEDRVRKNHNLVYFPDIKSVKKFNARLDGIGNIRSDGRPILGLDAADLLKIMLEINDAGFFVPAHIWTPWFSMFGSKSGFDSVEQCFGPLKKHIFAVETGLSSDPPMNWRVADLDDICLISNSDAHSPGYLGRNASVFNTGLSFSHIRKALETKDRQAFEGTLDMYPHHGKYHYDGHRKCNVCLNPADTARLDGICPECGKPLTCGVLYRVQELATRPEGYQPENRHGFKSIIPLADILSEIFQVGPKTKKVTSYYNKAVHALGPELRILTELSIEEIKTAKVPLLAEAVEKMRTGDVTVDPGFDGEFGKVKLFTRQEKEILQGERYPLFDLPQKKASKAPARNRARSAADKLNKAYKKKSPKKTKKPGLLEGLNPEQQRAVDSTARAMIIQAGPGTGKTRILTAKIAALVSKGETEPSAILALTFTNKAAREMAERIETFLAENKGKNHGSGPQTATFHAFCLKLLKEYQSFDAVITDDGLRQALIKKALGDQAKRGQVSRTDHLISRCKQMLLGPADDLSGIKDQISGQISDPDESFPGIYDRYQALCKEQNVVDFEDLVFLTLDMLNKDKTILEQVQLQYQYVFIDEYQDVNFAQYELTKLLAGRANLVVIGDPDQSIYGFRGSDNKYFKAFCDDFPGAEKIVLNRNYRSTQTILDASFQMISKSGDDDEKTRIFSDGRTRQKLIIQETAGQAAEAVAIGKMIEKLVGGTSFFSMDAGKTDADTEKEYSFSDFAVLYRTRKEASAFIEAFEKEGIPFQTADRTAWNEMDVIKDLISLSRVMIDKYCLADMDRVISCLVGDNAENKAEEKRKKVKGRLEQLKRDALHQDNKTALQTMSHALNTAPLIGKDERAQQAVDTLMSMAGFYDNLETFLDEFSLNMDVDTLAVKTEKVSLMTMHAAKGLEFPVVFVAGCEQGLIPFAKNGETIDNIEEERRLFYVAMTRAMDSLCLTSAKKRRIYGISKKRQQSCFIADIEKQLLRKEKNPARITEGKKETQLELF